MTVTRDGQAMAQRQILVFPRSPRTYLNLIYLAARSRGHLITERGLLDSVTKRLRARKRAVRPDLFHLHGTDRLFTDLASSAEAREALDDFRDAVTDFRRRGGRVLWSPHDVEAEEPAFAQEEHEAARFMLSVADVVHVTHAEFSRLLEQHHGVAARRTVTVPHPSYQGIHDLRSSGDLRAEWGIEATRRVILWVGPGPGSRALDDLLAALRTLAVSGDAPVLLLPGPVHPDDRVASPDGVDVVHVEDVSKADLPMLFASCDLCVTSTRGAVDSASLSATLGVPVLMPRVRHLQACFDQPWVRYWDPTDAADSLAAELANPSTYDRPTEAMRAWSESHAPFRISRQMADVLEEACQGG